MNALVHLEGLHPPVTPRSSSYSSSPSPWTKTRPTLHCPLRSRRLYAGAKGFGVTIPAEKSRGQEGNDNNKKSNGGKDDDDEIPQVVFDRMLKRIVFYVGAPMGTGVGLLYLLSILKEQHIWDVPLWFPFVTTLVTFGTSALGIAYGTLSSSWDPEREGSLLGWEEAQKNWPELWKHDDDQNKKR